MRSALIFLRVPILRDCDDDLLSASSGLSYVMWCLPYVMTGVSSMGLSRSPHIRAFGYGRGIELTVVSPRRRRGHRILAVRSLAGYGELILNLSLGIAEVL